MYHRCGIGIHDIPDWTEAEIYITGIALAVVAGVSIFFVAHLVLAIKEALGTHWAA